MVNSDIIDGKINENDYAVKMSGITKVYPNGIAANKDVDFFVRKGEIHALMGENGAGKSTLVKILFGIEQPTSGKIEINGEEISITSPQVAIGKGIGMVHQHFMLVPSLTVAENVVLGIEPRKAKTFIDYKEAVKLTEEISKKYNLHVDPYAKVMDIPVGMKQKVEILKALIRGANILILDEPTAVLTTQETEELFKELKALKEIGFTIIFISHKLNEIKEITDRLTILRNGRYMGVYNTDEVSKQDISRLMVGRDVILSVEKDKAAPKEPILKIENLRFRNQWGKEVLRGVSLNVRRGEILGIAGVEGNGQRELVDILFNIDKPNSGDIRLNDKSLINCSESELRELGISYIPEDRMTYGVADSATIEENLISDRIYEKRFSGKLMLNSAEIAKESEKLIEDYQILCRSRKQQVRMLSGGNIQKVVVAREFSSNPDLIIADQPTRGIDVGATEFIRKKLVSLSREGAAVLLVSADLNEVMELSDSLVVFYEGQIVAYFEDTSTLTDIEMGEYMLGLKRQTDEEIRKVTHID
ncbi:MAG: ABC transporter ATP-binding protein [Ruminococcaceae bacterium]|nr:ABC transporter ATP-binding protein [Oscillospiraceae bacterium]